MGRGGLPGPSESELLLESLLREGFLALLGRLASFRTLKYPEPSLSRWSEERGEEVLCLKGGGGRGGASPSSLSV